MAINVRDLKTGVRYPVKNAYGYDDEVVEYACPHCNYVWLEYASAEDYPSWCPGCGDEIEGDGEHAAR